MKSNSEKASKSFWNAIKSFFTNTGIITTIDYSSKKRSPLKRPKETTAVFNKYYTNTVDTTSEKRPSSIGYPNSKCQDRPTVKELFYLTKTISVLSP